MKITDEEIEAIRKRTGGAVADQVNRLLRLGPYAERRAQPRRRVAALDSRAVSVTPQRFNWRVISEREL